MEIILTKKPPQRVTFGPPAKASRKNIKGINIIEDKDSGEPRISHRIDKSTGMYKGRLVLEPKKDKSS